MAIVVEDGTGLANAQSFNSLIELNDWASARALVWSGADSAKEPHAVRAADYLRNGLRFRYWRGVPLNVLQRLPFPRTGVVTADGLTLPDGVIPWQIKDAHAALSILSKAGVDLQPSMKNGGLPIISKGLGPLSTTWASPTGGNKGPLAYETFFSEVIGYLTPLLIMPDERAEVSFSEGEVDSGYANSSYTNTNV